MRQVTLRIHDHTLVEDIDRLANLQDQTRNAWIINLLEATIYGSDAQTIPARVAALETEVAALHVQLDSMARLLTLMPSSPDTSS